MPLGPAPTFLPAAEQLSSDLGASAHALAGRVRQCLPWDGMSRIPEAYERFAGQHFLALNEREDLDWKDACPAYALGYLTHTAYGPVADREATAELEAQWDELRGVSRLDWPEAYAIVREAWAYLAFHGIRPPPDRTPRRP
ncbi:hypothetical protein [Arenimonas sp. MALMAid1274]|uniref:hypothetical protein n=1 Tax=Arenimonas sp. MALMAid1274 TaxID=3411630 RepID=UPI003BA2C4C5